MYAGVYAFLCSSVLLVLLYPISNTLVMLLSLPAGFSSFLLAGPVAFIGAGVWWTVVERRDEYTYLFGAAFGMLTAFFAVLFWVLVFTAIYGSLVLIGGMAILFVFVVSLPAALVTGLTLMYARRWLDNELPDGKERTAEQVTAEK